MVEKKSRESLLVQSESQSPRNTRDPCPRLVGEVDDTPPEDGHDVRFATTGVSRYVACCSIDSIESAVVAAYRGGVRAAHVNM